MYLVGNHNINVGFEYDSETKKDYKSAEMHTHKRAPIIRWKCKVHQEFVPTWRVLNGSAAKVEGKGQALHLATHASWSATTSRTFAYPREWSLRTLPWEIAEVLAVTTLCLKHIPQKDLQVRPTVLILILMWRDLSFKWDTALVPLVRLTWAILETTSGDTQSFNPNIHYLTLGELRERIPVPQPAFSPVTQQVPPVGRGKKCDREVSRGENIPHCRRRYWWRR